MPNNPIYDMQSSLEHSIWSNDEYIEPTTLLERYCPLLGLRDNQMLPQDEYPYEVLGLSEDLRDNNLTEG